MRSLFYSMIKRPERSVCFSRVVEGCGEPGYSPRSSTARRNYVAAPLGVLAFFKVEGYSIRYD